MRDQAAYDALRAAALCVDCRKPSDRPTKARCTGCAKKLGEAQSETRRDRLAAGLCPKCGKAPASDTPSHRCPRCDGVVKACPSVVERTNATRAARKKADQCLDCGDPLEKSKKRVKKSGRKPSPRCTGCRRQHADAAQDRKQDRIAAGLCPCGQRAPAPGSTRCEPCLFTPHGARSLQRD